MSREFDCMVAGHVCFDFTPRFYNTGARKISDIMTPGKLVKVGEMDISTGGPVSNTGINMKTLGNKMMFCARVGDDAIGKMTQEHLNRSGNAEGIHRVEGAGSSYTVVIVPPGIDRIFLHNPGTNDKFGADDLDLNLIKRCRHFHFGYPPLMQRMFANDGEELMKVFQIAKQAGATTSCDMALCDPESDAGRANWNKILQKILPHIDIFLPSLEEAFYMLDPQAFLKMKKEHDGAELIDFLTAADYSRIADQLLGMGPKMTALKCGHRGFYFKTREAAAFDAMGAAPPADPANWGSRELWAPAFSAPDMKSATGSGDSSIAGFLSSYLRGLPIERALRIANCVGWQNVQQFDALSGIQSWEDTLKMADSDKPMNDVDPGSEGWQWKQQFNIWAGPDDPLNQA